MNRMAHNEREQLSKFEKNWDGTKRSDTVEKEVEQTTQASPVSPLAYHPPPSPPSSVPSPCWQNIEFQTPASPTPSPCSFSCFPARVAPSTYDGCGIGAMPSPFIDPSSAAPLPGPYQCSMPTMACAMAPQTPGAIQMIGQSPTAVYDLSSPSTSAAMSSHYNHSPTLVLRVPGHPDVVLHIPTNDTNGCPTSYTLVATPQMTNHSPTSMVCANSTQIPILQQQQQQQQQLQQQQQHQQQQQLQQQQQQLQQQQQQQQLLLLQHQQLHQQQEEEEGQTPPPSSLVSTSFSPSVSCSAFSSADAPLASSSASSVSHHGDSPGAAMRPFSCVPQPVQAPNQYDTSPFFATATQPSVLPVGSLNNTQGITNGSSSSSSSGSSSSTSPSIAHSSLGTSIDDLAPQLASVSFNGCGYVPAEYLWPQPLSPQAVTAAYYYSVAPSTTFVPLGSNAPSIPSVVNESPFPAACVQPLLGQCNFTGDLQEPSVSPSNLIANDASVPEVQYCSGGGSSSSSSSFAELSA
eukprot:GHVT01016193.1.p1 GENE.GHVT01016193.1~~GHVT01016193.1.p1  ORF type:complete len:519 (-),score=153.58 GHVT01016193.1:1689-3245(-)